jgi:hypothetical protein
VTRAPVFIHALPWWVDLLCATAMGLLAWVPLAVLWWSLRSR